MGQTRRKPVRTMGDASMACSNYVTPSTTLWIGAFVVRVLEPWPLFAGPDLGHTELRRVVGAELFMGRIGRRFSGSVAGEPPMRLRSLSPLSSAVALLLATACSSRSASPVAGSTEIAEPLSANANARTQESTAVAPASGVAKGMYYLVLEGPAVLDLVPRGASLADPHVRELTIRRSAVLRGEHEQARPAIEATGARVVADFRKLANAIQVEAPVSAIDALRRIPGVLAIEEVPRVERSLVNAVPLVGGDVAWNIAGSLHTGQGIRIGIADTGIDYLHADFGGPGTQADYLANDRAVVEPGSFPTSKVIGGRDFVGDAYDGTNSATPDDDPIDCAGVQSNTIEGGHGTHVAGIVAGMGVRSDGSTYSGPYEASLIPSAFRVGPGVAPGASLYALKIFGCTGSTQYSDSAFEWAVDPNNDGDLSDRLDVVNASLGSEYGLGAKTSENVVKNLTAAGTLLVVAAGNSGEVFYIAGAPATYTEALAVAATTNKLSFEAFTVNNPASVAGAYATVEGSFTKPLADTGPITADLVIASPEDGCSPLTNAAAVQGKVVLIARKPCPFVQKVQNALAAGAVAAVVTDNEDVLLPMAMGGDTAVDLPGVFLTKNDGDLLRAAIGAGQTVNVTLDANSLFQAQVGANQIAGFSSRGPRISDSMLKPDLAAPGQSILSAGVASGNRAVELSGTSMACPMVTGAAALVRELHPDFSPGEVKAALMNTAGDVTNDAGDVAPLSLVGSGRMRVDAAVMTQVTASAEAPSGAVSVSFGAIVASSPTTATQKIVITNRGASPVDFAVSDAPIRALSGVTLTTPASISVPAASSATIDATLTVDPALLPESAADPFSPPERDFGNQAPLPRHFLNEAAGHVVLTPTSGSSPALRVPYYAVVRAADERAAVPSTTCAGDTATTLSIAVDGPTTSKAPVVSAFQLVATSDVKNTADPMMKMGDLRAVGVATNLANAASIADAFLYIGVAVEGEWTSPARGLPELSVITVDIDTNDDKKADFKVVGEAVYDVLRAYTYPASSVGGSNRGRTYVNVVSRAVHDTAPYNNSVLILPASLEFIGLPEGQTKLKFRVTTSVLSNLGGVTSPDKTDWIEVDLAHMPLDTSRGVGGVPLFGAGEPVSVAVDPTIPPDQLPELLLLHHSNVQGKRFETLPLSLTPSSDIGVSVQQAPVDNTGVATFDIVNNGATAVPVTLSLSASSGALRDVTPSVGTCTSAGVCTLGSMAPGAKASVSLGVTASAASTVTATLDSVCDPKADNNTAAAQFSAPGSTPDAGGTGGTAQSSPSLDGYEVAGGCGCRANGSGGSSSSLAWLGLAAVSLAAGRRRTRVQ